MKSYEYLFQHVQDNSCLDFMESRFYSSVDSFCTALNNCCEHSEKKCNNQSLINICVEYSRKYGLMLSDKQRQLIDDLDNGGQVLLFPYQPNIFPSISVIAPAVHMEMIRKTMMEKYKKKVVPLYMFVDYDNCLDKRFLKTYIPNPGRNVVKRSISYSIAPTYNRDTMFSLPLPTSASMSYWKKQIHDSIINFAKIIKRIDATEYDRLKDNLSQLMDIIDISYSSANTFAAFNELFVQEILIHHWNCGILFLEGHSFHGFFRNTLLDIEKNTKDINASLYEALACFTNAGLSTSFALGKNVGSLIWKYRSDCGMRCSACQHCFTQCEAEYIFPNVIADYLMDYLVIQKVGGVGYYKQFEATCVAEYILKKTYHFPGVPHLLSSIAIDAMDSFEKTQRMAIKREFDQLNYDYEKFSCVASDSHCSILFHLAVLGLKKTIDTIMNMI